MLGKDLPRVLTDVEDAGLLLKPKRMYVCTDNNTSIFQGAVMEDMCRDGREAHRAFRIPTFALGML